MKDINKTKKQLVDELANLRRCISEMEVAAVAGGRVAQEIDGVHRECA
jgi:hypothetical protein